MATLGATKPRTAHPHISKRKGYAGGKPAIHGTRIKVSQIVIYHNEMGYSPAKILEMFPHLNLEKIYDALSYYYDHQEEIDRQIADEDRLAENLMKDHVSILERERGANTDIRR